MATSRHYSVTWASSAAVLLAFAAGPSVLADVPGALGREPWRLITAHFCHGSALHAVYCLVLFVPLACLRERAVGSLRFAAELVLLCFAVSVGVRLSHLHWPGYRGLSGVVYGLIPLACGAAAARGDRISRVVILGVTLKSILEYLHGGWIGMPSALSAAFGVQLLAGSHLAGLAGGALLCLVPHRQICRKTLSANEIQAEAISGNSP